MIKLKNIVAILDLDALQCTDTTAFLKQYYLPHGTKSAIVTNTLGKIDVHPSSITAQTLLRRSNT